MRTGNINTALGRQRYNTFIAPIQQYSAVYSSAVNSCAFRPINNTLGLPESGNQTIVALISGLLFICCPTNIAFFIMTIYINTVNRVLWCRFSSNSFNKILERAKPKFNAASTIVFIKSIIRIGASLFGLDIRSIFRAFGIKAFVAVALARDTYSACKRVRQYNLKDTARASAKPKHFSMSCLTEKTDNRKFAESLTSQNLKPVACWFEWIKFAKFDVSHFDFISYIKLIWLGSFENWRSRSGCFYFSTKTLNI